MTGKVKLYYFDGRGKMESIRWLLAVAGVEVFAPSTRNASTGGENCLVPFTVYAKLLLSSFIHAGHVVYEGEMQFEEVHLKTREQYEKLLQDGSLMFEQVPMVEMDGMKLVQSKAILNYISAKHNLYGKDLKERVMIDMYAEGLRDLMEMIMKHPFLPEAQKQSDLEAICSKATERYLPVYEKALAESDYLVGSQLSCADVHLLEAILMLEEKFPSVLSNFPHLQAFQTRIESVPAIHKFLQPNSQRKPQPDENYIKTVRKVLNF